VEDIYFSDQDFHYKRKENGVHLQFDCIPDKVFFPWVLISMTGKEKGDLLIQVAS
jgi:hypothetical protein